MLTATDRLGVASGELSRRAAWLEASALVSQSLLRPSSSLMDVVQEIADHVLRLSGACILTIVVTAPDDPALLEVRVAAGEGAADLVGCTVPKRPGVAGSAMSHDQGRFSSTADPYSSEVPTSPALISHPVLAVPIRSGGGQPVGAIVVQRRSGQPSFDAIDLSMAEDFARQTSLVLELAASRASQDKQHARGEYEDFSERLHDDLLQRLFSIGMTVQHAEADLRRGEDSPSVSRAGAHLARAVDDLNATIRDVRASLRSHSSGRRARKAVSAHEQVAVAASLLQAAALHAAEVAQVAVVTAADRAAEAASTARARRSAAVVRAAAAVAARVSEAAAAVESEADLAALTVAQAAFDAAFLVAASVAPGSERDAAVTATLVATAVSAIAIKTAAVTAAARAEVARDAAVAAAAAAVAAADAEKILDLEVAYAAEAVQAVARRAARVLAERADVEASALALALR